MNFWTVSRRLPRRIILIEDVENSLFDYEENLVSSRYVFYDLEREKWTPFDGTALDLEFDDPESAMRYLESRLGVKAGCDLDACLERIARYTVDEVRSSIDNLVNDDLVSKLRMVGDVSGDAGAFDRYARLLDDVREMLAGMRGTLYPLMGDTLGEQSDRRG